MRKYSEIKLLSTLLISFLISSLGCNMFVESSDQKQIRKLEVILANAKRENDQLVPLEKVIEIATKGDVVAQAEVGMRYYDGREATQDYKAAYSWLLKAAKQGHADAQRQIASYYYYLAGPDYNFDIPNNIKELSAEKKYKRALFWFTESSNGCNGEAQYNLSHMGEGDGLSSRHYPLPLDSEAAVSWILRAASNLYNRAIYDTTRWYLRGYLFPKNAVEGLAWNFVAKEVDLEIVDKEVEQARANASAEVIDSAKKRATEILKEISINKCNERKAYQTGDKIPEFPE